MTLSVFSSVALVLAALVCTSNVAGPTGGRMIHVTIIGCSQDSHISPVIKLDRWADQTRPAFTPQLTATNEDGAQPGVYHADLVVDAGNYLISASSSHCRSPEPSSVAVFPSWDRHVLLITSKRCCSVPTLYGASLAVLAPDGINVDIFPASSSTAEPSRGIIDNGISYFSNLRPGSYVVELRASGVAACRAVKIPEDLSSFQELVSVAGSELPSLFQAATSRLNAHVCGTT